MNLKFWQSRWTRLQVESITVVSTGYICTIRSESSGKSLNYFFSSKDIKKIEFSYAYLLCYQPEAQRRMLVIKKAALRKRGLWQEGGKSPNLRGYL